MARQPIDLTYNTDLGFPVDSGLATPTQNSGLVGRAYAYNDVLFRISCVDASGASKNLSAVTNWRAGYGLLGTGSALVSTNASGINQPGDWVSMDPSVGKISVRMDLTTSPFLSDLGTLSQKNYYLEVQVDLSDGLSWQTLFVWNCLGINTVLHPAP